MKYEGLLSFLLLMSIGTVASATPRNALIQCNSLGPILNGTADLPQASDCTAQRQGAFYKLVCSTTAVLEYTIQGSTMRYESTNPLQIWPQLYPTGERYVWEKPEIDRFKSEGFGGLDQRQPLIRVTSAAGYPMAISTMSFTKDGNTITGFEFGDCSVRIPQ